MLPLPVRYYNTVGSAIHARHDAEFAQMSPLDRETELFCLICREMPIELRPDDVLAGWYGAKNADDFPQGTCTNVEKSSFTAAENELRRDFAERFHLTVSAALAHTCIDYGGIVQQGLIAWEQRILQELKSECSAEKAEMLRAMLRELDAIRCYAGRYADLAEAELKAHPGDARLARIAKTMRRVPYLPANDFTEAVNAVWIMHSLIPISEGSWASISLGRIDQYLLPLYERSKADGASDEDIKEVLRNLFRLLNGYGDGACALNIGGLSADGKDETNALSRLFIEVEKELRPASPIMVARVSPATPEAVWDDWIDESLFTIGQPTFYGELPCREALVCCGMPQAEAEGFAVNSCMGLFIPKKEIASMWGCVVNMHLPLEMALTGGKTILGDAPKMHFETVPAPVTDLESLFAQYERYLRELLRKLFDINQKNEQDLSVNHPNPLLSMLTENCIATGLDRIQGAKYLTETVETVALANTANAICAVDTLVFRQKKYTAEELIQAARCNYEGYGSLLRDIRACPKYGTNDPCADGIAHRLCTVASDICRELSHDRVYYLPSLHTIDNNVYIGAHLYAMLDGRLQGTPIAKNAGPTDEVRSADPTGVICSAAALEQSRYSGGQPIDLYFDPSLLKTKESRDKLKALIKTYFQLGGLQLQVNSIDLALLEKAYAEPEAYPQVIVRIGGYSRNFCDLSRNAQKDFIDRFRLERGN